MSPGRDYVIAGTAPWDTPWLTDQNLAHALGAAHRALYVEPPLTPLTPLRRAGRRELRALARRRPVRRERVSVFRPLALPPLEDARARAISRPLLRAQLRRACGRAGMREPVLVAMRSLAALAGAAGEALRVLVVKDWLEAGGELIGRRTAEIARDLEADCAAADLVLATSPALCERLAERGVEAALLRHGFHADLAPVYDGAPRPADYSALPRPLLGYAGRIDGRLDFELLARVAERFRDGSLLLIGPISPRLSPHELARVTSAGTGVRLLGARSREELPALLRHLDCALLPYRASEWSRHGAPLKLWDCLYAGPPIVGAGYTILRDYPPPLVRFADGAEEFATAVEAALRDPARGRDERRALALANSWDARAEQLDALVEERLGTAAQRDATSSGMSRAPAGRRGFSSGRRR